MPDVNLPPNIENYARIVSELQAYERLTSEQKKKLAICKLRIALWACKTEGMPLTRYSLSEILGPDTAFVFVNAQSVMIEVPWESAEDRAAMKEIAAAQMPKAMVQRESAREAKQADKGGKKGGKKSGLGTYK